MNTKLNIPLVSVCCITYNHEKYIRDCIEGFLMQKTSFPIEIIIHDDASTDSTQDIIREYANKDNRIIPILREQNIKSTGVAVFPITYQKARGKYIALCEGDDYWTDPYKLQKQVDILEAHPEYSMCFSARKVVDGKNNFIREKRYINKIYSTKDVVDGFIPSTQTILMRKYPDLTNFLSKNGNHPSGDRLITYYCSLMGDIYYLDEITACYRESGEGVWSSFDLLKKQEKSFERLKDFYVILGIDENNFNIIYRGVYEFYVIIKSQLKSPVTLIKNLRRNYLKIFDKSPFSLVLIALFLRIKRRIIKVIKIQAV